MATQKQLTPMAISETNLRKAAQEFYQIRLRIAGLMGIDRSSLSEEKKKRRSEDLDLSTERLTSAVAVFQALGIFSEIREIMKDMPPINDMFA